MSPQHILTSDQHLISFLLFLCFSFTLLPQTHCTNITNSPYEHMVTYFTINHTHFFLSTHTYLSLYGLLFWGRNIKQKSCCITFWIMCLYSLDQTP